MGDGVEVLGVDAGQAPDPHPAVHPPLVGVVEAAEDIDLVAAFDQADRDLLDVPLDPAVGGGDPLLADHGDPHAATSA